MVPPKPPGAETGALQPFVPFLESFAPDSQDKETLMVTALKESKPK